MSYSNANAMYADHEEFEKACARIEREREMFFGARTHDMTMAEWQTECAQTMNRGEWMVAAEGFIRSFPWENWRDEMVAGEEIRRMWGEKK